MKKITGLLVLLCLSSFLFISCEKEERITTGNVRIKVLFENGKAFSIGADVYLYYSKDSMDKHIFAVATQSSKDNDAVCYFSNLAPATYFVKAQGSLGSALYSATGSFLVEEGKTTEHILYLFSNGDLRVFVREQSAIGVYIGGASVSIYYSEDDWKNNQVYQSQLSSLSYPVEDGALFSGLNPQKYFVKASYTNSGGYFEGNDSIFVPYGTETRLHIVCQH
ncbi:MAG: hypothetical protein HOB88_07500 [Bacteroidetes bacterium]|nr:hypothetical protein [Bacteroidota bacterium]